MRDAGRRPSRPPSTAEGADRETEDKYRALVETTNTGFVILGPNGSVQDANAEYVALTGHRHLEEILGRTVIEWTVESDRERNAEEVRRCLAGEPVRGLEVGYVDRTGKVTPVEINATAIRTRQGTQILTLCRDISARRSTEEALRSERDLLQRLMDGLAKAGIGIDIVQDDFQVRFQNQALVARFGDGRGQACYRTYLNRDLPCDDCSMRRAVQDGTVQQLALSSSDGRHYELTSVPLLAIDGTTPRQVIEIIRDVTDRERLEAQLRQAQKMEALGQLAGGVAHDFNNLLVGMFGYLDMAIAKLPADLATTRYLLQVRRAADRAAELSRQLLAFSRRQLLEPRNVELDSIVTGCVDLLRRIIGESITLTHAAGSGRAVMRTDPGQLEQALINLCVNARDAMPHGGTIAIETATVDLAPAFCAVNRWARPGRYAVVRVADDGHGMSEEVQKRIFEPFFTTKDAGKGTGLGLSTVYGMVLQHGGLIHCSSTPGVGTTFSLYFPVVGEAAAPTPVAAEAMVARGSETLLVAEDDPVVQELVQEVLETAGYRVLAATSGPEALATYEAHAAEISLCILDVVLPGRSGPDVWTQMQSRSPDLRALFTSGYAAEPGWDGMLRAGRVGVLSKPYTPLTLLAKVRELLDER